MSKDIKLVFLEMKTHIFMYILPLVIIYCIFMPYCISEIQYIDNPMQKELTSKISQYIYSILSMAFV